MHRFRPSSESLNSKEGSEDENADGRVHRVKSFQMLLPFLTRQAKNSMRHFKSVGNLRDQGYGLIS